MYYQLKENLYSNFGTARDPELPWTTSFSSGGILKETFELPLKFCVDNPPDKPPGAIEGICVPVFSAPLVDLLRKCGVDNLQLYDALLVNEETHQTWEGYFAVNIVGKVSCAEVAASRATPVAKRPGDGSSLYKFHHLVIDPGKTHGLLMFRIAEQPSMMVVHQKIVDALEQSPNPQGGQWGISCIPIDEI